MLRPLAAAVLLACASGLQALPVPPRPEHDVLSQELVLRVPGMEKVSVHRDVPFERTESGHLTLDLYYPPDFREGSRRPAVVFINGVGDQPSSKLKDWEPYRSWGRLVAASGWIGVTFENRGPYESSRPDMRALFRFLRDQGGSLGIDKARMAAWVCSGNVVSGLPFLMEEAEPGIRGAVVYYGSGTPERIRADLRVFFVRAGRDNPQLNGQIDALAAKAMAAGAPWTLVSAPGSHHAFDVLDETEESRRIVGETLDFFREVLSDPPPAPPPSAAKKALGYWFGHEYLQAAEAYGEWVKMHPEDETAYMRLGLSQAHAGKRSEAEANLEKALALGADRPIDLFNASCGYALVGRTERALELLERAVAAGFGNRELLSTDHDLDALRGSPRFQVLLERAKP